MLRNQKCEPPICKIMNYKMEVLKRLFKKLGRGSMRKDDKAKSLRFTTSLTVHDLENKKRQATEMLKQVSILRFFMKVNVYDAENVQKGRMILSNLAEDLKEYGKVKVSPMANKKKDSKSAEKKPKTLDEIKDKAQAQSDEFVHMGSDLNDDVEEDLGDRASYIFMEMESTASFKDIDIDKMLEHTTLDDFMKGLYMTKEKGNAKSVGFDEGAVMGALLSGQGID